MCVRLCVFNQANKSQSLRCRGRRGLIKTVPAAGGETRRREEQELAEEKLQGKNVVGEGGIGRS